MHAIFIKLLSIGSSQFYIAVNHKLTETKYRGKTKISTLLNQLNLSPQLKPFKNNPQISLIFISKLQKLMIFLEPRRCIYIMPLENWVKWIHKDMITKKKTTILHVQRQENTAYSSNKLYMLNHKWNNISI